MFRFGTEQYWHGVLYHHGQPGRRYDELKTIGSECYEVDKRTYHVSAALSKLPQTTDLPSLLEDFHAREVLHATFGSAIGKFGVELRLALIKHETAYYEGLHTHFEKHLNLLKD